MTTHSDGREQGMRDEIRGIIQAHGRLATPLEVLTDNSDLYQAGMTSHASVNLMLALEDRFGVEFPERMLKRRTFESIASICLAIAELLQLSSMA